MNIMDIIRKPPYFFFGTWSDKVDEFVKLNKNEYYFITFGFALASPDQLNKLLTYYSLSELFALGNCYLDRNCSLATLWHITKEQKDTIKTSDMFFDAHSEPDKLTSQKYIKFPQRYNDAYISYLNTLDKWIVTGSQPEDVSRDAEFNTIQKHEFDVERPFPRFYRKLLKDLRPLISASSKNTVQLGDIAHIYTVPISLMLKTST